MEETITKKKLRNFALVEGYLREVNLKEGVSSSGTPYISGDVIVASSQFNSQRVKVFVFETNSRHEKNKAYDSIKALMGEKVVSLASYVASLPGDGTDLDDLDAKIWDAATKVVTKVWLSGSLEEYATISVNDKGMERETSTFSFRATNGGIHTGAGRHPFSPRCVAEIDGTILGIHDEQARGENDDLQDTGRVIIDYLYIDYKGVGHKFKLIATDDLINPSNKSLGTYANYIRDNYEAGQTAMLNVAIVNLVEKEERPGRVMAWGQTSEPTIVPKFVHELRLYGGRTASGIGPDSPDFINKDQVVAAQSARIVLAKDNAARSASRKASMPPKISDMKGFVVGGVKTDSNPKGFLNDGAKTDPTTISGFDFGDGDLPDF